MTPRLRPYVFALITIFVVCLVAGFFAPAGLRVWVAAGFRTWAAPYRRLSHPALFVFILVHNASAALIAMVLGMVYGILPIVSVAANGALLGMVVRQASIAAAPMQIALKVVPHGVFELPALMIALAHGLWLGQPGWGQPAGAPVMPFGQRLRCALGRYVRIVLPLLVVAAAIEAFVVARIH